MSVKVSSTATVDKARMEAVKHAVAAGFSRASRSLDDVGDAKDELDKANEGFTSEREGVMQTLAAAAEEHAWTEAEISAGISAYIAERNGGEGKAKLPSTLQTFKSQITTAMHPNVRDDFARIQGSVRDAWDAEGAEIEAAKGSDTKAETPLRKAHKRRYFMLTTIMVAAKGSKENPEGVRFYTSGELVAHAKGLDPDDNAGKLLARVGSAIKSLEAIKALVSDVEDLDAALDMLGRITETEMANGRCDKLGIPRPVTTTAQPKAAPVTTVVNPTLTPPAPIVPVAAPLPMAAAPVPAPVITPVPAPVLADDVVDAMEALLSNAA